LGFFTAFSSLKRKWPDEPKNLVDPSYADPEGIIVMFEEYPSGGYRKELRIIDAGPILDSQKQPPFSDFFVYATGTAQGRDLAFDQVGRIRFCESLFRASAGHLFRDRRLLLARGVMLGSFGQEELKANFNRLAATCSPGQSAETR